MNYGPNEKMTQIQTNKKDTETVIFSETYEYNKDEQIIKATNNESEQKTYAYTKEGFLQSVTRGSGTTHYTYDLNGNLLKSEDQSGKFLSENKYLKGNRISTSIQYDQETNTYRHISYEFRENGSLAKETIRKPTSTSSGAEQAVVDVVKEYQYSSFNLLMSITTKQGSTVVERIEYTYDSEDNRTSKKVTNAEGERFEFYYYDSNGDLVSVSRKVGLDSVENTMNFYRDASGKLLNFEYKGKRFDYIFNQRGDVVAITDEVQEVIARYSYDEWGNLIALEGLTPLGQEVAEENPYRYVGHYGVQYDSDNGLYFMGWRDYDAKIGRFIVADEYEGDETDPISFNTYLYAEADPVNNIDPDGHFAKWIKKLRKGVKKGFKKGGVGGYDFLIGDDLKTITSKNTRWYQKVGAAAMIASNFVPGLNVVGKVAKAARATYKAVKTVRATYTVAKAVVKTSSKRVAGRALHATKTVGVKSYRNTKKLAGTVKAKAQQRFTRKSTAKTSSSSSVSQRNAKTETRYVKNERKTESTTQGADEVAATSEIGAKGTGKIPSSNTKVIALPE